MRFKFVASQVWQGLKSNISMTIAVILVTFISLLFVGSAALLQMQINNIRDEWYDKVEITVSMCVEGDPSTTCNGKEATEKQIKDVGNILNSQDLKPFVKKVYFEDKEQAFKNFKKTLGNTALGQGTTADMLPVSYRIKLVNPEEYKVIQDKLSNHAGVQSIIDQKKILQPLFTMLNAGTVLSLGVAGVMVFVAILLITTTIKLSAMSRRKETSIMRFVGASNFFIQLPFMLEGAISALIGALFAVVSLFTGVYFLIDGWLKVSFPLVNFVTLTDVLIVSPLLILAAIVLAGISSVVSLGRYTKI
ncbi:ABC transporter permease [Actinomyces sp. zg-332]|uniref:permease-like cell division protein FtsX n=1 Tax=Actinomyces sp. zg-332 TaxID=2708340 RepID=UPI00141E75B2|nr:permease-like cell division protein FtsX [Actinomyces sp. zg-332]QPK93952.1 ABC transporter permease [Actinomyces sp. zg-332]